MMGGIILGIATVFGVLSGGMIGALVGAWENDNYDDMFIASYLIGGFATVSHALVVFGL